MLRILYESVVGGALFSAAVSWESRLRVADTNRLNKMIHKASHVVGEELDSLRVMSERKMLSKLRTIVDSPSHHLHNMLDNLRRTFSNRLIPPLCYTENPSFLKPSDFITPH